jgi:diguanylate cyclase (GGDEF)-like protein
MCKPLPRKGLRSAAANHPSHRGIAAAIRAKGIIAVHATHREYHLQAPAATIADPLSAGAAPADSRPWQSMFFRGEPLVTQEQAQAVTRIVLAAFGCVLFWVASVHGHGDTPFLLAALYLMASMFHVSFVTRHKEGYLWRRYLVMLSDLLVAAYLTAYFGPAGIAFYPLFLWVIVGNGLRYGRHAMQVATLFGLLGFSGAMGASGLLWSQPGTYIGLMFGLVLMPRFFLVMIERLAAANVQLKAQKDEAEYMAMHDVLTGLPNRAGLHDRMQQALARARRHRYQVAIAFIDLDAFKSINDAFGHDYGDELLRQIAAAMQGVVRGSDTVTRLGGDEFVVLLEDCGARGGITSFMERLFACVGRHYDIGEYQTYVTWSCGVVVYPRDGEDVATLLKHADTAMYAAKAQGANRYAFYDPAMSAEVAGQLALRDELRAALELGQFEVWYQPIVDAGSGRMTAAEALLRWHHPERGLVSPGGFIEVAEQSGIINPLGHWVIGEALDAAAAWRERADIPVTMHANVSAHQLRQDGFVDQVRGLIEGRGLPSCVLDLEMTEGTLLEDPARAERMLATLQGLGIRIALDDFGTGFSSLSYLKRLPVDLIKIDKSFVDDIPRDPRACALVEAVLTLGRRFALPIVAEGVETVAQRDWLLAHGCRFLQGYLFSRPLPLVDFLALADRRFDLDAAVDPAGAVEAG